MNYELLWVCYYNSIYLEDYLSLLKIRRRRIMLITPSCASLARGYQCISPSDLRDNILKVNL